MRTKQWHDPLVRSIGTILRMSGYTVRLEAPPPPSLLDTNKRTDLLFTSVGGAVSIGDVRTAISTNPTIAPLASEVAGHAAHLAQLKKEKDWSAIAYHSSSQFVPLVAEDGGRLGPALLNLIEEATFTSSTAAIGSSQAALRTFALQKLHLCNARGVAKTILWNPLHTPGPHRIKPLFRDDLILDLPQCIFPSRGRGVPLLPISPHRVPPPWLSQASAGVPPPSASTMGSASTSTLSGNFASSSSSGVPTLRGCPLPSSSSVYLSPSVDAPVPPRSGVT